MNGHAPFADRREAGRRLVELLEPLQLTHPLVLALPRGGVPVGYEVATALGGELDVLLVRKLGAPGYPELALGAINDIADSAVVFHDEVVWQTKPSPAYIEEETRRQRQELARRRRHYVGDRLVPDPGDREVVVVDDGIATGLTARVALLAVRMSRPRRLVLAVPVAAADALDELAPLVDEVVAVIVSRAFSAVGTFYDDFSQTGDNEVVALLAAGRGAERS